MHLVTNSTSRSDFRLLNYEVFDGAMNMALDEAILESFKDNTSGAVLRFYGWQPDAVSIGYGQKLSQENIARIAQAGFDVVKRPTGGRAVLHKNELTYSFVCHQNLVGKSIQSAYEKICSGLIEGFKQLKLDVQLGQSSGPEYRDKQDCFLATTNADLQVDGLKLVGSAQLRRGDLVLQHGSILLNQPQSLMPDLLGSKTNSKEKTRHANLFELLNKTIELEELEKHICGGFEIAFQSRFSTSQFNKEEIEHANKLRDRFFLRGCLTTN